MGTLYNYTRNLYFTQKWNMKKQGIVVDDNNSTINYIKKSQEQNKAEKLSSIITKLKSGMKLSSEEMDFLRQNSPETYKKVIEINQEREEYRRELKKCKTKDEVVNKNTSKVCSLVGQARSVSGSGSAESMEFIQMKVAAINDEHVSFVKSVPFSKLKWQREIEREDAEIRNAAEKSIEKSITKEVEDTFSDTSNREIFDKELEINKDIFQKENILKPTEAAIEAKIQTLTNQPIAKEAVQREIKVSSNKVVDEEPSINNRRRRKFSARA